MEGSASNNGNTGHTDNSNNTTQDTGKLETQNVDNRLAKYIASQCGTNNIRELQHIDSLHINGGLKAPSRARTKTTSISVSFEGSAAGFDVCVENGYPIKMSVAEMLSGNLKKLYPNRLMAKDRDQGVKPESYDPTNAFMTSISLARPLNTLPFEIGIGTNGIPAAYEEERQENIKELSKAFGQKPRNTSITAHVPSSAPNAEPDERSIPLLKSVVNSYHGEEVVKTFGGITAKHLWGGLMPLEPALAQQLGLLAPPANHRFADPPPGVEPQFNSWVIVPTGHVLGHISTLTSDKIRQFDYCVYQLKLGNGALIPFLLMDLWTLLRYGEATTRQAILKIDQDRISIPDVYIQLHPVTRDTFVNSCMAGQHYHVGKFTCTLVMTYVMFPKDFRQDGRLRCALSDGFPRMSLEMRQKMDTTDRTQLKLESQMEQQIQKEQNPSASKKKVTFAEAPAETEMTDAPVPMDTGDDNDDDGGGSMYEWGK